MENELSKEINKLKIENQILSKALEKIVALNKGHIERAWEIAGHTLIFLGKK